MKLVKREHSYTSLFPDYIKSYKIKYFNKVEKSFAAKLGNSLNTTTYK